MAQQNHHTEYIITQQAYDNAYSSLPEQGTDNQIAQSTKVVAKQYRLNVSNTVHAGKWSMWAISEESFEFTWQNGAWQPPQNLVVLK
ncbi:hypothetical protein [Spirosoma sp. KUDC1026]|uniref:hypothetical protein n=1 Tax=Spirosoma sp. KUDC1026 TaxID=2745947 RepID=UPI00159BC108|nr:hypothetical protein [Spirosoma sp. KUDC1026]QKZ14855.1 hypothetical protein HU175_20385 [Spirosoma sp. KUDC1026]